MNDLFFHQMQDRAFNRFLVLAGNSAGDHRLREELNKNRGAIGVKVDHQGPGLVRRVSGTKKARLGYQQAMAAAENCRERKIAFRAGQNGFMLRCQFYQGAGNRFAGD
jgi:hypothetical protein